MKCLSLKVIQQRLKNWPFPPNGQEECQSPSRAGEPIHALHEQNNWMSFSLKFIVKFLRICLYARNNQQKKKRNEILPGERTSTFLEWLSHFEF